QEREGRQEDGAHVPRRARLRDLVPHFENVCHGVQTGTPGQLEGRRCEESPERPGGSDGWCGRDGSGSRRGGGAPTGWRRDGVLERRRRLGGCNDRGSDQGGGPERRMGRERAMGAVLSWRNI
ncbi:unnamed protein product, partial [Amoebophrya sp. A120]